MRGTDRRIRNFKVKRTRLGVLTKKMYLFLPHSEIHRHPYELPQGRVQHHLCPVRNKKSSASPLLAKDECV